MKIIIKNFFQDRDWVVNINASFFTEDDLERLSALDDQHRSQEELVLLLRKIFLASLIARPLDNDNGSKSGLTTNIMRVRCEDQAGLADIASELPKICASFDDYTARARPLVNVTHDGFCSDQEEFPLAAPLAYHVRTILEKNLRLANLCKDKGGVKYFLSILDSAFPNPYVTLTKGFFDGFTLCKVLYRTACQERTFDLIDLPPVSENLGRLFIGGVPYIGSNPRNLCIVTLDEILASVPAKAGLEIFSLVAERELYDADGAPRRVGDAIVATSELDFLSYGESEDKTLRVKIHHLEVYDHTFIDVTTGKEVDRNKFLAFLKQIDCALRSGQSVYLCCSGGKGRSVVVAMGYLMVFVGMSLKDANSYLRHYHPIAKTFYQFSSTQQAFLLNLEKQLAENRPMARNQHG